MRRDGAREGRHRAVAVGAAGRLAGRQASPAAQLPPTFLPDLLEVQLSICAVNGDVTGAPGLQASAGQGGGYGGHTMVGSILRAPLIPLAPQPHTNAPPPLPVNPPPNLTHLRNVGVVRTLPLTLQVVQGNARQARHVHRLAQRLGGLQTHTPGRGGG